MDLSQVHIETERLLLVPRIEKYAEQIFAEYREPITKYMNYGAPESLEILKERCKDRETEMKQGTHLSVVVLLKQTREFLGRFALEEIDKKIPEMGGWIKASAHGNHYGQEACKALKQWADNHLDYDHIIWPCAEMNIPSRKLAEALGGTVEKHYIKTTVSQNTWPFVEYWIPKKVSS